jgi:hypothetical protein
LFVAVLIKNRLSSFQVLGDFFLHFERLRRVEPDKSREK